MGKRERGEFTGGGEQRKGEREMMQSYLISKKQKIKGPNFFFMCMGVVYRHVYLCTKRHSSSWAWVTSFNLFSNSIHLPKKATRGRRISWN